MKCPRCQTENREGVGFCEECGAKLEVICAKCGASVPLGKKFCGECGHDLGAGGTAPFIDYTQPQSYTPRHLADKILTARSSIEGERKLVTVLFADVTNYTSLSEKLDPEEVHQIMDGCFRLLMDEIHRYEGTIDKFTGDGVMALFGAPVAHEYHAQRACYAALAIQRAMHEYGKKIRKECGVEFKMRVGLNSGPVVVGSIGNDLRMDYTAIGDTTNLASRMESMARPGTVLVSADTHRMARDFFKFDHVGKVKVKGKEALLEAYELVEASAVETRFQAAVAKGLTKFVGRDQEIAALEQALEKARSGSGQVVGVVGEAGVGKSRILLELKRMVRQEEYTFLEGRCLHYGGSMPYLPLLDIVRSYFDIREGDREFVVKKKIREKTRELGEEFEAILEPLHEILSLKVDDEEYLKLEPPQKRGRTFEALRDLLIRESQNNPLVLAVEDLHWIDRTSEEFLTYLIGWLANARILLILLYRPEYTNPWGSKSYYSQIGVDQLSVISTAELVQAILEGGEVVPEVRELILGRAGGNPLFVEEFTRTLVENGSVQRDDGQYVLSAKASDIQVPDTVQGIIAARMDRLEETLKRTMQVASVIGRDFAYRILDRITGMQEELKSYLLDLQGLEFIYEKSLFPELEYMFKHALTQEVAYNSLLVKRRREIHERIGEAIESLYPDRLEELYEVLAHHYSRSANAEKAYDYLKLSGEKAARSSSNWEAVRLCREAIDILKRFPESEENKRRGMEVRLLVSGPMRLVAYPEGSLEILQEGARLSQELGDATSLAKFSSLIGAYYSFRGDSALGMKYCESSFEVAQKIDDIDLAAPSAIDLCHSYFMAGDYFGIVEVAPKAIALLEKTRRESEFFGRPLNVYSALLVHQGHSLGIMGDFEQGQALCEKGLRFAHEIRNPYSMGFVAVVYGMFLGHKGDGENAVQHFEDACRYLEETQALIILGLAWSGLGWGYRLLGDPETALKHTEKGLQIQRDTGIPFFLSLHHWRLGEAHLDLGNLDDAQTCAEEALRLSQNNNEKWAEGASEILLGRVLGKTDVSQSGNAEQRILEGISRMEELKLRPYVSLGYLYLGELWGDVGDEKKALKHLKAAEAMFREMGMDHWLRRTQEVRDRVRS